MKDYAVVSLHEKGFWQVDVYWKMEQPPEEGDVPDHFKTCKTGEPPHPECPQETTDAK